MKILLITYQSNYIRSENPLDKISLLSSIYTFFFNKYLSKIISENDIDIKEPSVDLNTLPTYDHAFILINRGTSYIKNWELFRSKVSKHIFTISPSSAVKGKENYLIHYAGKRHSWSVKLNWMADPSVLLPKKHSDKLVILVDHKYYGDKDSRMYKADKSETTIKSLLEYKKNNNKYNNREIVIKHIIANNIITINEFKDIENTFFRQGMAVPFSNVANAYNEADIFVNTHIECMGLTNLECAMAGALVLTFPGYLKDEFRNQLHHYVVNDSDNFDWNGIFSSLNPELSRQKVINCTYENNINHIYHKYLK